VPSEYEHSGSKRRALHMSPKKQKGAFLQNGSNGFDYISIIMKIIFLKLHGLYVLENNSMHSEAET
jgi:hypothetical protein